MPKLKLPAASMSRARIDVKKGKEQNIRQLRKERKMKKVTDMIMKCNLLA